jgi:hypothetical protein
MAHEIRFVWTVPRSVSTSFERMMSERGDHLVIDEPFSRSYYYGPDRRSARYDATMAQSSAPEIIEEIEQAAEEGPVFVKDMAYQASEVLSRELLQRFSNSFLVRHPAATLRSLARRWPDFTDEEAGWSRLGEAADLVESLDRPLVVLDADSLCHDPERVVKAWCERMGLPFIKEALSWQAGMRPEWDLWEEWHGSSSRATGFTTLEPPPPPPGPDEARLLEAYQTALPVYERLSGHAIGAG